MALVLNDDQKMLQEAALGFVSEQAPVSAFRTLRDDDDPAGFSRDLWHEMAQMGWAGIVVPEEFGGSGFDMVGAGLIAEEMGKQLTASPFLSTAVMAASALARFGSEAQKSEHLPALSTGERLFALAVDESNKHGPAKTAMSAVRSGNGFKLNGKKTFVADGHVADQLIVATRTSGDVGDETGITLFLVDAKTVGVECQRTPAVDSRNYTQIDFNDVEVTADSVVGEIDEGYGSLETILNCGRAGLAAEMVGSAGQAFSITLDYLKERKQFGVSVASFQALQHRTAHLYTELEIARAVTLNALQKLDDDPENSAKAVAVAKTKVGQVALIAAQEGIQLHGGMGMTDAFDIGLYIKRIKVACELFGDDSFHGNRLAQLLGY